MTDLMSREQAVTGEIPKSVSVSSDAEVTTSATQIEAYISKNKGVIIGCVSNLPSPILAILRSVAHLLLCPLHVLSSLKLHSIYEGLNAFANGSSCQPPAPAPAPTPTISTSSSDCAPQQIM